MKHLLLLAPIFLIISIVIVIDSEPESVLITNIKLIDGTGEPARERQSVLIVDGLIKKIGNAQSFQPSKNTEIVDGTGKTMIPGLIGVHNHLHIPRHPFIGKIASKLYLASGVTTIQTAGAAYPYEELELAKQIELHEFIGPEIIPSGPYITGDGGNPNMIIPQDESALRDTIRYWANKGAKWIKVYRNVDLNFLEVVIEEAHNNNMKVTGHLCSITFQEASELGIDAIEHGFNSVSDFREGKEYGKCSGSRTYIDELPLDAKEVDELLQLLINNGTVLTSSLSIYEASIPSRSYLDERSITVMSDAFRGNFKELDENRYTKKDLSELRERRLKRIMEFEYRFYKMGGILAAGVDAGRHILPGFGDQRNFQLLLEAGFSVEEAIHIMTKNGAVKLGRDDIGTIEIGKKADFVLLEGDLKKNEDVIHNVNEVYKNGMSYEPDTILKSILGQYGLN